MLPKAVSGSYWVLIVISVISSVLIFSGLGNDNFSDDEYFQFHAAAGLYNSGTLLAWDFIKQDVDTVGSGSVPYTRALPYTALIALSFKLFGVSEWSARLPAAIFSFLFVFAGFWGANLLLSNKYHSLLFVGTLVFLDVFLFWSRFTRMYTAFMLLFFISACYFYRFLTSNRTHRIQLLSFDYSYLVKAVFVFAISFSIHINTLLVLPAIFLFTVLLAVSEKSLKHYYLVVAAFIFILFLMVLKLLFDIDLFYSNFICIRVKPAYEYLTFFFRYPFRAQYKLNFLMTLIAVVLFIKQKRFRELSFFISMFSIVLFFTFFSNKHPGMQYMLSLLPFILMFQLYPITVMADKIINFKLKLLLMLLPVLYIIYKFSQTVDSMYYGNNYKPKYAQIFSKLAKVEHEGDKRALFIYPLRTYYINKYSLQKQYDLFSLMQFTGIEQCSLLTIMQKYSESYLGWTTIRDHLIPAQIKEYANQNLKKISGKGIDSSNIELYLYRLQ